MLCCRLLRINDAARVTGLSVAKILELERAGRFPRRVDIGKAPPISYVEDEVVEFANRLQAAFRQRWRPAA
jgi:predicted DNA-binding transcriptional regulator AlpA